MAVVTLKDALTYHHMNRTFIKGQPLTVMNPEEVKYYKNNAHFDVQEPEPKRLPPRKAAAAVPAPAPRDPEDDEDEEPATDEDEELEAASGDVSEEELAAAEEVEQPAPASKAKPVNKSSPAYRKGQFMKGGKRA